jgi:hypothetical protein
VRLFTIPEVPGARWEFNSAGISSRIVDTLSLTTSGVIAGTPRAHYVE